MLDWLHAHSRLVLCTLGNIAILTCLIRYRPRCSRFLWLAVMLQLPNSGFYLWDSVWRMSDDFYNGVWRWMKWEEIGLDIAVLLSLLLHCRRRSWWLLAARLLMYAELISNLISMWTWDATDYFFGRIFLHAAQWSYAMAVVPLCVVTYNERQRNQRNEEPDAEPRRTARTAERIYRFRAAARRTLQSCLPRHAPSASAR